MSDRLVEEQALLTSLTLFELSGEKSEQRRLTRLITEFQAGESISELLREPELSGPGRFGSGIEESAILLTVITALHAFWKIYLDKVVKKAAKKASDYTLALLDRIFAEELQGTAREEIVAEIKKCLEREAAKQKIGRAKLTKLLEAVDRLGKK